MHTSMLFVTLALTLAKASAQIPQQPNIADFLTTPKPYIPIISKNEVRDDSGQVISSYQSADGTSFEQVDVLRPSLYPNKPKVIVQQGTYSYTSPDGTPVQVSYIADEKGFRAVGTHIFGEVPQVPDVPEGEPLKVTFPATPPEPAPVSFPLPPSPSKPVPSPPASFPAPLPVTVRAPFPVAFPPPPPAPLPTPFPAVAPVPPPAPQPVVTKSAVPAYPFVTFPTVNGAQVNPSAQALSFPSGFIRQI